MEEKFDKDEETHFQFYVVIEDKRCEVHCRKATHKLGEWNHKPDNWWAKIDFYTDKLPYWIPWVDTGANRPSWGVSITTGNSLKYKWEHESIRSSGSVSITCNKQMVYSFPASNIDFAFAKAQYYIKLMEEHPFNFYNPESEIGRKIWYFDQPGIISSLRLEDGEIFIKYDGDKKGFNMKKPYDSSEDPENEWDGKDEIRDDIFSNKIWWFRE